MSQFRLKSPRLKIDENAVERQCLDLLRARGYYILRLQSGLFKTLDGRFVRIGEPGIPDYAALHATRPAFFFETKAPGRSLSAEQVWKHKILADAYRLAVVTISDAAQLVAWLAEHEAQFAAAEGESA